jgi:hypothetical protein
MGIGPKARIEFTPQLTDDQFERLFPTDGACKAYLTNRRWPDGVVHCPRCNNDKVWTLKARPFHWLCRNCSDRGYRFSVTVGTVFENSNVGLRIWFKVIYLMLVSKKGVSALQVHRMMGFGSYETAHYMCIRIRAGLSDPEFRKLMGIVEVDETYVGGRNRNRHADKRTKGRGIAHKAIIVGALERQGSVGARVLRNTDSRTLRGFVREAVTTKVDLLATDELTSYVDLTDHPHKSVCHCRGEYVVGAVHTQTIDGFRSLIKRGIMGAYHRVSAEYLPLFVAEFEFRYNNRKNRDILGAAIARC